MGCCTEVHRHDPLNSLVERKNCMPISFAQIASNTATVTVKVGEHSVHIDYYPGRVTERSIAIMYAFGSTDADTLAANYRAFNGMLVSLIKSWDVFEDEEETVMFPLDAERMADLPVGFRMSIANAILEDLRPEAVASQASQNGSV